MRFVDTSLHGVLVVEPQTLHDERGLFARTWSAHEFAERGLVTELAQCSVSFNTKRGTLRGMHWQAAPHGETKLVRVTRGAIYDVAVDVREGSTTWGQWFGAELSADNRRALYIPEGFAHGYVTLTDESEVFYQISAPYAPESARGARWNDPAFGITWPVESPSVISARDADYPDLAP